MHYGLRVVRDPADQVELAAEIKERRQAQLERNAAARAGRDGAVVCSRCGTPISDPVSVARMVGPECWGRMGDDERAASVARRREAEAF